MKFLADMGVSMSTIGALREAGGEVVHLREEGILTLPDDQILEKAITEQRVILTFDLDFGELLAAGGGRAPSVVLFRMRNQTPAAVTPSCFVCLIPVVPRSRPARSSSSRTRATGSDLCRFANRSGRPSKRQSLASEDAVDRRRPDHLRHDPVVTTWPARLSRSLSRGAKTVRAVPGA